MPGGDRRAWPTRDILRVLSIITGFYIALQLLWIGRSVVLLAFLGILLGLALTAGVDWLERRRIPRGVGAVLIVLAFLGTLSGIVALSAPSITSQMDELKTQLPEAAVKIQRWVRERQRGVTEVWEQVAPEAAPGDSAGEKPAQEPRKALAYVAIQQVESNLLDPLLMQKGLELPPVLTIVTQGVLAVVFGLLGLLVAVPLLAASMVPIKMLYVRDVVGDDVKLPGEEGGEGKHA